VKFFCSRPYVSCLDSGVLLWEKEHYGKRKIREAIEIELNPNNLNRDEGLKISEAWKPVLHNLQVNNNTPNN
jgi:hypothetical protein